MPTADKLKCSFPAAVRMASGTRVASFSMADPEMATRVAALHQRLRDSPADGIKLLKKTGILTRSGKLAKNFGG